MPGPPMWLYRSVNEVYETGFKTDFQFKLTKILNSAQSVFFTVVRKNGDRRGKKLITLKVSSNSCYPLTVA